LLLNKRLEPVYPNLSSISLKTLHLSKPDSVGFRQALADARMKIEAELQIKEVKTDLEDVVELLKKLVREH
jgi:hypothetical protein